MMSDQENLSSSDGQPSSNIVQVINSTGLPSSLRQRAQRWLLRLVGGTIAAPLVSEARDQMDTIEGRSRVNMLLADGVARQAIADPELMERAKARFLGSQFRKQENLEAVAQVAADKLGQNTEATEPSENVEVDEDWMNLFSRYAEDASTERMRNLFGKVLAGEVRKSGSYSPATMRFITELDQQTAQDLLTVKRYVVANSIPKFGEDWNSGEKFELSLRLQAAGLLSGVGGFLNRTITIPASGNVALAGFWTRAYSLR